MAAKWFTSLDTNSSPWLYSTREKIKLNLPVWVFSEQLNFPSKQKFKSSGSFGKKMSQATKSQVTLKGSSQMVAEFFNYGINSILYQRGVYPPGMISWKTLLIRYLSRLFDCLAHPHSKPKLSYFASLIEFSYQSLAQCHLP